VLETVTSLLVVGEAMSVAEIHAGVERTLGERIPTTTVRDALSVHSRGSAPRFRRLRHGIYGRVA
jgi:hypothetical protein